MWSKDGGFWFDEWLLAGLVCGVGCVGVFFLYVYVVTDQTTKTHNYNTFVPPPTTTTMDSQPETHAYTNSLKALNAHNWSASSINVNIPGHPEVRFSSPSGRYEVEVSPVNGYDDGKIHQDRLHFFVNAYTYYIDEDGNRIEEEAHVFSRKCESIETAVEIAEQKIAEFNSKRSA